MTETYDWMVRKFGRTPSAAEAMEFGFREGCRNTVTEQHLLLSTYRYMLELANREDIGSNAWKHDVYELASGLRKTCKKLAENAGTQVLTEPFK